MHPPSLPTNLFTFFLHFLGKQKAGFTVLLLTILGWPINEMVIPYLINQVVDTLANNNLSKDQVIEAMLPFGYFLISMLLVNELLLRANDWIAAQVFPRFRANVTMAMFGHAKEHSHQYFAENFAGSIGNRVTKLSWSMSAILFDCLHNFVPVTSSFVLGMILMWLIDPLFSGVLLGWFIVQMGTFAWLMQRCQRLSHHHSASISKLNGAVVDVFTNITTMRLFARGQHEQQVVSGYQQEEKQRSKALMLYMFKSKIVFGAISIIMMITWWGLTFHHWYHDHISIGDVTQLLMQQWALTGLVWYMGMQLMRFYEEVGVCNESLTVVREAHDISDAPDAKPLQVSGGEIVFKDVNFQYGDGTAVFTGNHITLKAGERVGLVGFSGSGKSTFVNLILRLYDLTSGQIIIDGQDIASVTRSSLRERIAMIPQDPTLFHRSLRDNIFYGRLDATEEEIITAAKQAHCHDFIQDQPEGYDTLVGERGVKLSGGQRQRIAIARAILKDAPILILDEATSALDSVSEKHIQQDLHTLMQGRTVIAIAHRLSTLSDMDRILVFDQGEIVEDGTHQELLAAGGQYATLWQQQVGGFLP